MIILRLGPAPNAKNASESPAGPRRPSWSSACRSLPQPREATHDLDRKRRKELTKTREYDTGVETESNSGKENKPLKARLATNYYIIH